MRTPFSLWTRLRSRSRKVEQIHHIDEKPESARKLRRGARVRGRKAGRAAAFGYPQAERMHDLPGRLMLETAVAKRTDWAKEWIVSREQTLRASVNGLAGRISGAAGEVKAAKEHLRQAESELANLRDERSPNLVSYVLVLGLLAAAEYPTLQSALQVFPGDGSTRRFLAIILSGVLAVAAHYLATRLQVLRDAREEGQRRPFDAVFVAIFVVSVIALMAAMGLARGDAFARLASLTGGAFGDPALLTALMLAVQVMLFIIALAVGLQHAGGDRRRAVVKRIRRADRALGSKIASHERLIARKALDQEELKNLGETEQLWLAKEDAFLGGLLHRHDHAYESTEHSVWTRVLARIIAPRLGTARA